MYLGRPAVKAVHLKLSVHEGPCPTLEGWLNNRRINVLSIHYAHNSERLEKWALVIYEEL